jgi:hypothetical protein
MKGNIIQYQKCNHPESKKEDWPFCCQKCLLSAIECPVYKRIIEDSNNGHLADIHEYTTWLD